MNKTEACDVANIGYSTKRSDFSSLFHSLQGLSKLEPKHIKISLIDASSILYYTYLWWNQMWYSQLDRYSITSFSNVNLTYNFNKGWSWYINNSMSWREKGVKGTLALSHEERILNFQYIGQKKIKRTLVFWSEKWGDNATKMLVSLRAIVL